jgi:phosphatidyl-myo-inositol alpha-mannosyltransferase
MKIGLVCPYDMFRGGGVQEHVLAQAERLRERGYEVKIITPRPRSYNGKDVKDMLFVGNSALLKMPIKTSLELGVSLGRDFIDDLLLEENFDIIHIHEPEVPLLGAQIVAKANVPIVATFHAVHPDTQVARTIEALRIPYSKSIFSKLTEITAVSEVAAGFVRGQTGRQVTIIPNGIDLGKYKKPSVIKQAPHKPMLTILYVGRLEKRKGVRYLLKAYKQLLKDTGNVELVIVGDGPDRERLEAWVEAHKVLNVTFKGFVPEKLKLKLLGDADIFCSPALYGESFGIVLLEAMAMGVVSVAGNNVGYSGVMKGPGQISIVNPKNIDEFADRLALLLNDQQARQKWLDWAEQYVVQFDYEKVVDAYEKLYKKVAPKI